MFEPKSYLPRVATNGGARSTIERRSAQTARDLWTRSADQRDVAQIYRQASRVR